MKWFSALVWKWSRLFQTLSQRSYQIEKIIFREAPGSTKQITLHVKNAVEFMNQGSANTSQIQPICQLISHISRNLLHENQTIKLGCPKSVHLHFRESDFTILTTINKWFSKKKKKLWPASIVLLKCYAANMRFLTNRTQSPYSYQLLLLIYMHVLLTYAPALEPSCSQHEV